MGWGFIGIIRSWMLSEGRVWCDGIQQRRKEKEHGSWNRSIWLGLITTFRQDTLLHWPLSFVTSADVASYLHDNNKVVTLLFKCLFY